MYLEGVLHCVRVGLEFTNEDKEVALELARNLFETVIASSGHTLMASSKQDFGHRFTARCCDHTGQSPNGLDPRYLRIGFVLV